MSTLAEKRVYADRIAGTTVAVACGLGLLTVSVAEDRIGEFGLAHRCTALDLAVDAGQLAVATDEDVLLGPDHDPLGFGPAVAVAIADGRASAASPEGRIARTTEDGGWEEFGSIESEIRAIDGDLVATGEGVYRLDDEPSHVGLSDVRDVAARGVPLAATGDALYVLGNGWMEVLEGEFVAADVDRREGLSERACAATETAVFVREDGEWVDTAIPAGGLVDVAVREAIYAITGEGELLVDAGDGWQRRSLGVPDVRALAAL
ncbi:HVO_0234 family beta-propeller protein [Natronorarus salvus]|uniref:HVO_0234 family beta-propeller protein n=1 Tax=Natronorarus salvus TaxID=3117733 RepID=UPI002F26CE5C